MVNQYSGLKLHLEDKTLSEKLIEKRKSGDGCKKCIQVTELPPELDPSVKSNINPSKQMEGIQHV